MNPISKGNIYISEPVGTRGHGPALTPTGAVDYKRFLDLDQPRRLIPFSKNPDDECERESGFEEGSSASIVKRSFRDVLKHRPIVAY